jgi:hypothetical protein
VLFAPKLELTSTLPTGVTFTGSGTLDNVPYQAFGSALNPSASSKAQLTFSGVAATGTLSLAFTFRDDPVLTTSVQDIGPPVIDSATGQDLLDMPEGPLGKDGDNSRTTTTAFTPDGTMIVAQRNSCQVISYSASSGRQLASAHLGADLGQVPWLVTDHGGTTVYAAVSDFRPKTREHPVATDTQIVRLDATTLAEYPPRLSIGSSLTRSMMLTPDDRRLIVATAVTSQGLLVIDTTTFQIENRIIPDFKVEAAALSPDGKTIAAVGQSVVGIYDLAGRLLLKYPTPGTPGMRETHMWAAFGSSSLLWISRLQEVDSLDLRTGDSRVFTYAGGLAAVFDGKLYTHAAFSDVSRFDAATGTKETSLAFGYAGYSHWLGRSPF